MGIHAGSRPVSVRRRRKTTKTAKKVVRRRAKRSTRKVAKRSAWTPARRAAFAARMLAARAAAAGTRKRRTRKTGARKGYRLPATTKKWARKRLGARLVRPLNQFENVEDRAIAAALRAERKIAYSLAKGKRKKGAALAKRLTRPLQKFERIENRAMNVAKGRERKTASMLIAEAYAPIPVAKKSKKMKWRLF